MTSTYSQQFSAPPSLWGLYSRILAARKPAQMPEGRTVPRLEARLSRVRIDPRHLQRYRALCGGATRSDHDDDALPIAYPHLLASPLHLAILGSGRFPVAVFGLVHVANRIEQHAPLGAEGGGELACWLQGHEQTVRGQEFELYTEWRRDGRLLWRECSRFLARQRAPRPKVDETRPRAAGQAGLDGRTVAADRDDDPSAGFEAPGFRAPAGLGRRYGALAGDVNPIHIADLAARAFGFRAAIAHGMWSLARCAAELGPRLAAGDGGRVLEVQFRAPVFLPAALTLRGTATTGGLRFELRDAHGARIHLAGTLRRAA